MVAASATSPLTVLGSGSLTAYWRFQRAVVAAQLQAWLPPGGRILVDISGPQSSVAPQAAAAGYAVLQVMPRLPAAAEGRAGPWAARPEPPRGPAARSMHRRRASSGRLVRVVADYANLAFLADGSVDGVIADDGALSRHLMAEDVAAEIARVLRPGGVLVVLWNGDDDTVEWVRGYQRALHPDETARVGTTLTDARPHDPAFGRTETRRFANPVPTTIDGFVETIATHSWALIADPRDRDASLARMRAYLAARPETSPGAFTLPMVTDVVRTLRR